MKRVEVEKASRTHSYLAPYGPAATRPSRGATIATARDGGRFSSASAAAAPPLPGSGAGHHCGYFVN